MGVRAGDWGEIPSITSPRARAPCCAPPNDPQPAFVSSSSKAALSIESDLSLSRWPFTVTPLTLTTHLAPPQQYGSHRTASLPHRRHNQHHSPSLPPRLRHQHPGLSLPSHQSNHRPPPHPPQTPRYFRRHQPQRRRLPGPQRIHQLTHEQGSRREHLSRRGTRLHHPPS
jgi:hypothetical protein